MNFPREYSEPGMQPKAAAAKKCNDEDPAFRCACVDCPAVCPELPAVEQAGACKVGALPCLSFAAILVYGLALFGGLSGVTGRVAWKKYRQRQSEGQQLLLDPRPHDDDDDDDDGDHEELLFRNGFAKSKPGRYSLNTWCTSAFRKLGHFAARFPGITIGSTIVVALALSLGWTRFSVERDPARLWVSPTSAAAEDKAFFDANFGPFYRTEKIFLVNDVGGDVGPVLSYDTLRWWMDVEKSIRRLKGPEQGVTLDDVCFKPTGSACVIQSVGGLLRQRPGHGRPEQLEGSAQPVR